MKTIKIIELLNKIANGEDVPKQIRYKGEIYNYINGYEDYKKYDTREGYLFAENFKMPDVSAFLNDEVEIIEDTDKKLEKLDMSDWNENDGQSFSLLRGDFNKNSNTFANKINEIIDYINNNDNHIPRID